MGSQVAGRKVDRLADREANGEAEHQVGGMEQRVQSRGGWDRG